MVERTGLDGTGWLARATRLCGGDGGGDGGGGGGGGEGRPSVVGLVAAEVTELVTGASVAAMAGFGSGGGGRRRRAAGGGRRAAGGGRRRRRGHSDGGGG